MVTLASPDAPRRRSPLERLAVTSQVHGVSGCGNKRSGQLRASSKIFPLFDTVNVQFKIRWWGLGIQNGNNIVFLPLGWCGRCCLALAPTRPSLNAFRSGKYGLCTSRLCSVGHASVHAIAAPVLGVLRSSARCCVCEQQQFSATHALLRHGPRTSRNSASFVVLKLGRCARLLKSFGSVIREMIRYEVPTHVRKVSRRVG